MICIRPPHGVFTRGAEYEVIADGADNDGTLWLRDDTGHLRWPDFSYFAPLGTPVEPRLVRWKFDEPVVDPLSGRDETHNWVDVSLQFADGTWRWCFFVTPKFLLRDMEDNGDPARWSSANQPGWWATHMVVARDLREVTVDSLLCHLDNQGELFTHSLPLESGEPDDEAESGEDQPNGAV